MAAVELALEHAGARAAATSSRFAHGMTVGTNALLEERGARTALLATEGFTDVIEIGRQARPELYRLCQAEPAPLVPAELRFGVRERIGTGRRAHSARRATRSTRVLERVEAADVEAVAISLLHSYADPSHERRVAAARRRAPARSPRVRLARGARPSSASTSARRRPSSTPTSSPLLRGYLERLAGRAPSGAGLPEPEIMQSSGGVLPAAAAARHAAWTVLSGPAGGAVGAAHLGALADAQDVLSFDMGGTSCDVAVVDGGKVRQTPERTIGGRVLQLPMVDVHTVGAGGGSIAWVDAGGALRVGPQSAGADPGPACYGARRRGGDRHRRQPRCSAISMPTRRLAGRRAARRRRGRARASRDSATALGLDAAETAAGIVRVADQEMLGALRVVTVERGVDPRGYALVAFGGAGPMHAARIAEELEINARALPAGRRRPLGARPRRVGPPA